MDEHAGPPFSQIRRGGAPTAPAWGTGRGEPDGVAGWKRWEKNWLGLSGEKSWVLLAFLAPVIFIYTSNKDPVNFVFICPPNRNSSFKLFKYFLISVTTLVICCVLDLVISLI